MSGRHSRRTLIKTGLGALAGASGLAAAVRLADRHGLISTAPPSRGAPFRARRAPHEPC